jgi:hypothetical protein
MSLVLDPPRPSRLSEDDFPPEIPFDEDGSGGDDEEGDDDPTRWVTVATFWQPTYAHIARLKLESEGIDCFIIDENLVATDWLWANAVGGIKLQVPEEDLLVASEILRLPTAEQDDPIERCPLCKSTRVRFDKFSSSWSFILILTVGMLLLFIEPMIGLIVFLPLLLIGLGAQRICERCGHRWRSKSSMGPRGFEVLPSNQDSKRN